MKMRLSVSSLPGWLCLDWKADRRSACRLTLRRASMGMDAISLARKDPDAVFITVGFSLCTGLDFMVNVPEIVPSGGFCG